MFDRRARTDLCPFPRPRAPGPSDPAPAVFWACLPDLSAPAPARPDPPPLSTRGAKWPGSPRPGLAGPAPLGAPYPPGTNMQAQVELNNSVFTNKERPSKCSAGPPPSARLNLTWAMGCWPVDQKTWRSLLVLMKTKPERLPGTFQGHLRTPRDPPGHPRTPEDCPRDPPRQVAFSWW